MTLRTKALLSTLGVLLVAGLVGGCKERSGAPAEKDKAPQTAAAKEPAAAPPQFVDERPARLAGSWYAKDGERLKKELDGYLAAARDDERSKWPKTKLLGLVAPHAGYRFSGRTAASAYALLEGARPKRVFVIGPSHYTRVRGVALTMARRYATPLGPLTIDAEAMRRLARHPLFLHDPSVDAREHSVEVQMPFIKRVAPEARVVPLLVGRLTLHEVRRVADVLRAMLGPGDVVVASSDFTHYGPNYRYVPFGDPIVENLRKLDMRAYAGIAAGDLEAFWRFKHETESTICGFYPVSILRAIVGDGEGRLLRYDTSGRVAGDHKNSVSYLAVAFSAREGVDASWRALRARRTPTKEFLAPKAAQNAVRIARRALEHHFSATSPKGGGERFDAKKAGLVLSGRLEEKHGVFVTLKRKKDKGLRGCIGHIIGRVPLHQGIVENALNAALRDRRFSPLTAAELDQIEVEVTVLSPPRKVAGPREIVIGHDGVILSRGDRRALFLPQVAVEQGWGLRRTLSALSNKAGLGPAGWQGADYQVFRGYVYEEHGPAHGG